MISSRLPALALEVDDVRLHEHRAAVAELRERLGAEGDVGELLDLEAEAFARSIAGSSRCPPSTAC